MQFEVIDLELDLLLRKSRLVNFFGGVMHLGIDDFRLRNIIP